MKTNYTIQILNAMQLMSNLVSLHNEGETISLIVPNNEMLYRNALNLMNVNENDETDVYNAIETLEIVAGEIVDRFDSNLSVFGSLVDYFGMVEACNIIERENYMIYSECESMEDVAEYILQETGADLSHIIKNNSFYIDEKQLLHDLYFGGDIQNFYYETVKENAMYDDGLEEEEARKIANDYEITQDDEESYLEMVLEGVDSKFLERYFDYKAYGRDMDIEGTFIQYDNGYIEVLN